MKVLSIVALAAYFILLVVDFYYYKKELKRRPFNKLFTEIWRFLPGGGIVAYLKSKPK